jgi:hypothetical protein
VTVIDDARSRLQGRKQPAKGEPWRFPLLDDFAQGVQVLAFDATLSHTGWILFEVVPARILVRYAGIINPLTELTGYRATWDKARHLKAGLDSVILQHGGGGVHRVVEAPSVGGGSRTESSLIAGMLVWLDWPRACHDISATHVSAVVPFLAARMAWSRLCCSQPATMLQARAGISRARMPKMTTPQNSRSRYRLTA